MPDPSCRELIFQALVELWDDPDKPAGLNVHRNPARPIPSDMLPALVVSIAPGDGGERVARLDHSPGVERTLQVRAEIRTGDADIESLNEQTDEIYTWVVTQAALDRTLGGLTEDLVEKSSSFESAEGEMTYHALGVLWEVPYMTSEDDPSAAPEAP